MGDSIGELIDENQKATEALIVHLDKTLVIAATYDHFLKRVQYEAQGGAIYKCKETLKDATFALEGADTNLQKSHDAALEQLHDSHERAETATAQLRKLSDEVIRVTQEYGASIEKMNADATELMDLAHQHFTKIDEQWNETGESVAEHREHFTQHVDEYTEIVEDSRDELHGQQQQLETDIQEIGPVLEQHATRLAEILEELATNGDTGMNMLITDTGALTGVSFLKDALEKEFERIGGEMKEIEERLLDRMDELVETAGKGQQALHGAVSTTMDEVEAVSALLDQVQPLLNAIEDID
ncbi:MAG: hypothetical protein ACR2IE_07110 [Candidatus Sumerlaeaceae bacterium]